MARVIISPGGKRKGKISSTVYLQYSNGVLTVWENGKVILKQSLNKERVYAVWFTGGKAHLKKMYPPKTDTRLLAWLCGFACEAYCSSVDEYKEKVQDYYAVTDGGTLSYEWENKGNHYQMYWTQKKGTHTQPYTVACYIDVSISKEEIFELVPTMLKAGFGKPYIQQILQERLGITKEEFERGVES